MITCTPIVEYLTVMSVCIFFLIVLLRINVGVSRKMYEWRKMRMDFQNVTLDEIRKSKKRRKKGLTLGDEVRLFRESLWR